MERARELRENAERCLRLSRSINSPADVAWLEELAAEASEAADRLEADKSAGSAGHYSSSQQVNVLGSDGSDVSGNPTGSGMFPDRRRSGRSEVSPVLIPLLRSDSLANVPFDPADDGPDQLRASRGIFIWTLVSVVVWGPLLWWML